MEKLKFWLFIQLVQLVLAAVNAVQAIPMSSSLKNHLFNNLKCQKNVYFFDQICNDDNHRENLLSTNDAFNINAKLFSDQNPSPLISLENRLSLILCNLEVPSIYMYYETKLQTDLADRVISRVMQCPTAPTITLML